MTEQVTGGKHTLMLEKRKRALLTGVIEVISFDEENVVADTDCGVIIIRGEGLHMDSLNLEKGDMSLEGMVESITYEDSEGYSNGKGSVWSRIFR
jgi:sporulation protein YabP